MTELAGPLVKLLVHLLQLRQLLAGQILTFQILGHVHVRAYALSGQQMQVALVERIDQADRDEQNIYT